MSKQIKILFSDYFNLLPEVLDKYGALNICLSADLPLFIDPFLLFASDKEEYKKLHDKIVNHLIELKKIALVDKENTDLGIFKFPEVKQNWLGLCEYGNEGKGLGKTFATAAIKAFNSFYSTFGEEKITEKSHIEKLTLMGKGIGRDFISDFTTNLAKEYLLEYTQNFALKHLKENQIREFSVRCEFDYKLRIWKPKTFKLPYLYLEKDGDFIILSPLDILTKDDAFICYKDLQNSFEGIASSLENDQLRNSINNYFYSVLPIDPKQEEVNKAIDLTINEFPELIDYYIKLKEGDKAGAQAVSEAKRRQIVENFIPVISGLLNGILKYKEDFFNIIPNSYNEALKRANYLKDLIENNDVYTVFYHDGKPIANESVIQKMFKLTWFSSPYDPNSEVNNGRGPADFKVSYGSADSTIVEFKLAKTSSLERNLKNQTEIYKKASKSVSDIKVILCYSLGEIASVKRVLKKITGADEVPENIVVIDASRKKSASKV